MKPWLAEIRALSKLSLPTLAGQFAQTTMGTVDTLMAGNYGPIDLAAIALGTSIWFPVMLFAIGVLMAITPLVSHLVGAERWQAIAGEVKQGFWLALLLGLLAALALYSAKPLLAFFSNDELLVQTASDYLRALAWGMPAIMLYQVLKGYSESLSHTLPVMLIGLLGLLANIPLNYIFIYGKLGLPEMGGVGCGYASALVMWLMLGLFVLYIRLRSLYQRAPLNARWVWPDRQRLLKMGKLGLPIGLAFFVEISLFSLVALLLAKFGTQTVAGHQVALNYAALMFMVPLSFAMAITVRVGQTLGQGDPTKARYVAWVGVLYTSCFACLTSSSMLLFRWQIADAYSDDTTVIAIAAQLLLLAAAFQFSDAIQVAAAGALRGYKDTQGPLVVTLIAYWLVGLFSGYYLAEVQAMGAPGYWIGLIIGLTCAALLLGLRLHQTSQRHIQRPVELSLSSD